MKMRTAGLSALLFFLTLAGWVLAESKVAMITGVEGPVEIMSGEDWSKAMLMKALEDGTRFRISQGSLSLALFSDGSRWTIKGPAEGRITLQGPVLSKGSSSQASRRQTRKTASGNAVRPVSVSMGGHPLRARVSLPLLRPLCLGNLRDTRPEFKWRGDPRFQDYSVELRDVLEEPLWSGVVSQTSLPFPGELSPLKRGEIYTFRVVALKSGAREEATSALAEFQILSAAELQEVEALEAVLDPEKLDDAAILASHYLDKRLYSEALDLGLAMKGMNSEDPGVSLYLAEVYEGLGLVEDSEECLRLAQSQGAER